MSTLCSIEQGEPHLLNSVVQVHTPVLHVFPAVLLSALDQRPRDLELELGFWDELMLAFHAGPVPAWSCDYAHHL